MEWLRDKEREERITRCKQEIAKCQAAASDESERLQSRLGALQGEADWMIELEWEEQHR